MFEEVVTLPFIVFKTVSSATVFGVVIFNNSVLTSITGCSSITGGVVVGSSVINGVSAGVPDVFI